MDVFELAKREPDVYRAQKNKRKEFANAFEMQALHLPFGDSIRLQLMTCFTNDLQQNKKK